GGFSFGAAQSGLSVSLHLGIPPLCECLTKSEPPQLGKLRYLLFATRGAPYAVDDNFMNTSILASASSTWAKFMSPLILQTARYPCLLESEPSWPCRPALEHCPFMLIHSLRGGRNWRILVDKLYEGANEFCARGPVSFAQPLFAAVL